MSLVVGQNSWTTVAEADTYLENRIGGADWFDLEDISDKGNVSKETLLVSAFYWLSNNFQFDLSPSLTDTNVKHAQIEAALFLMEHSESLRDREGAIYSGVEEFKYSQRMEKLNMEQLIIPKSIQGLLLNYLGSHAFVELAGEYDNVGD